MATVDELIVLIKAQSKDFDKSIKDVQSQLSNLDKNVSNTEKAFTSSFSGIAKSAGVAGAALAGLAAVAAGVMVKGLIDASSQSEKAQLSLAGLINATTQFKTQSGQALGPVENLNASIGRAQELYSELRKQALLLADVETPELLNAATFALPDLTVIGVTEAKQQAELIGTVVASIKQLGIATSEIEQRKEISAFLKGDITGQGVEFAKLVAQVNGGTEAFKQNYAAALQSGQGFEFLKNSLLAFRAAGELSASTLSNKFSVLNDSINLLAVTAGDELLDPFKELVQLSIDQFFTKGADGAMTFNKELQAVSQEVGGNFAKVFEAIKPLVEPTFNLIISLTRLVAATFGETADQSTGSIEGIASTLQSLADFINAVADRAKSMAMIATGAFEALAYGIQTSVRAVAGIITGIIETAINAIKNVINVGIKGLNTLIAGANLIPGVKVNQVKEFATGYANTKIWVDAGKQSGQAYLKGLGKVYSGIGGLFGSGNKTGALKQAQRAGDDLTATSKANTSAGDDKKKKGKKPRSEAGDIERAALAKEEAAAIAQKAALQEKIIALSQQLMVIDKARSQLSVNQTKQQNTLDIAEKEREIKNKAALDDIALRKSEVEMLKTKKTITEKEAQTRLAALNQEEIKLNTQIEKENIRAQLAQNLQAIYNKNTELQLQAAEAEKEADIARQEKLGLLDIETQKIQSQIALLQGKKGRQDEIQKLNNELQKVESERQKITTDINTKLDEKLLKIQTELGLNDQQIEKLKVIAQKEQEAADASGKSKEQIQKNADSIAGTGTEAMDVIKNAAKQLGQSIAGAFEDGKVSAQEFGQIALDIIGQVITQLVDIGLNSLSGALGGGGGFGFAKGGIVKAATGGYISGPGTSTSDSIPALLSNGEYVINAAATRKFGPILSAINSGRFGKFASGGVALNSRSASYSMPRSSSSGGALGGGGVTINISAVDSQGVIGALSKKDVRKYLGDTSNQATQKSSNRAFNRSPFEFSRGR